MKCIDLFAGAGGFSEGARMAGLDVAWAANHWPAAVAVHESNHPDTEHKCQDLHQADWTQVPEHDILLASPCCIPEGESVVMADRTTKAIGELRVDDLVLTHEGRGRRVVNVWRKNFTGSMFSFRVWGDSKLPLTMTSDHQAWIRRRGGHSFKFGEPMFVTAGEVRPGDYVAFPRMPMNEGVAEAFVTNLAPERISYEIGPTRVKAHVRAGRDVAGRTVPIHQSSMPGAKVFLEGASEDLWWLVGHYLGDGQSRSDRTGIGWSVGDSEENQKRVREILSRLGLKSWLWGKPGNRAVFTQSKHLYALCLAFGGKAHCKTIPEEILGISPKLAMALVEGYLAADGSEKLGRANPMWVATSVSLPLLQGLQRLCWQIGWSASIALGDYAREATIEGRTVNCRDSWTIQIVKAPHAQSRTKFFDGKHVWRSVRAVESAEVVGAPVVDIEVEEDHTFCLPGGMVVHNCQGHSRARGKDRPHHDAARSTAWAVVSAAECHRPRAFVVENVPEFLNWTLFPAWEMAMKSLGYTLNAKVLDAKNFGVPQLRRRMFMVGQLNGKAFDFDGLGQEKPVPISEALELDKGDWRPWETKARIAAGLRPLVPATMARIHAGRKKLGGNPMWIPYFGSNVNGWGLDAPIWTITTRDRYLLIIGDRMRLLTVAECAKAMGFPKDYKLTGKVHVDKMLLGNAVCPPVPAQLLSRLAAA